MPYVVITRYTRPDPSVDWHTEITFEESIVEPHKAMMLEYHGRKTRIINNPDELTLEIEMLWESQELYEEYMSRDETVACHEAIANYNSSVGITMHPRDKFEI